VTTTLAFLFLAVFSKTSFSQSIKRIRGFGDDALYKFTFYITLHIISLVN